MAATVVVGREATTLPVSVLPEVPPVEVRGMEQVILVCLVWVGEPLDPLVILRWHSKEEAMIFPAPLRLPPKLDTRPSVAPYPLKEASPLLEEDLARAMEPRITSQDPDTRLTKVYLSE